MGSDDRAIITVIARSTPERRRFSAAHELGHWMRDRELVAQMQRAGLRSGMVGGQSRKTGKSLRVRYSVAAQDVSAPRQGLCHHI